MLVYMKHSVYAGVYETFSICWCIWNILLFAHFLLPVTIQTASIKLCSFVWPTRSSPVECFSFKEKDPLMS